MYQEPPKKIGFLGKLMGGGSRPQQYQQYPQQYQQQQYMQGGRRQGELQPFALSGQKLTLFSGGGMGTAGAAGMGLAGGMLGYVAAGAVLGYVLTF